jgi:hypothetical protein
MPPRRAVSAPLVLTYDTLKTEFESVLRSLARPSRTRRNTVGGGPSTTFINKLALALTILTFVAAFKYKDDAFNAIIDEVYPGLNTCFSKETASRSIITHLIDKTLGFGATH